MILKRAAKIPGGKLEMSGKIEKDHLQKLLIFLKVLNLWLHQANTRKKLSIPIMLIMIILITMFLDIIHTQIWDYINKMLIVLNFYLNQAMKFKKL